MKKHTFFTVCTIRVQSFGQNTNDLDNDEMMIMMMFRDKEELIYTEL